MMKKGFTLVEIMIVVAIIGVILAIGLPNMVIANEKSKRNTCIANLRQMDAAKALWAINNTVDTGVEVTMADLVPDFVKKTPTCPSGGEYTIGPLGEVPTCTISSHVLESSRDYSKY